jgi:signal transduction histidine kinase
MTNAPLHLKENERIKYLDSFQINSDSNKVLDELTELACKLTGVSKSLISIVDRKKVWFKSQKGIQLQPTPRELSFCAHTAVNDEDLLYIENANKNEDFKDQPHLDTNDKILFYAGVQLKDDNNLPIGAVCVLDHEPQTLNDEQKRSLQMIADLVMRQLQLHKTNIALNEKTALLEENNEMLKNFAQVVSHDMKMPLASMILTTDILNKKYSKELDNDGKRYLKTIKDTAFSMSDYVDTILNYYESDQLALDEKEEFDIYSILEKVEELIGQRDDLKLIFPEVNMILKSNSVAIEQILLNLIGNSIKYNDKEIIEVVITASETPQFYKISVQDNGIGIPKDKQESIFKLFTTLNQSDRSGKKGNGIGLSTVEKLVGKLGGNITCDSQINEGTTFTFTIKK